MKDFDFWEGILKKIEEKDSYGFKIIYSTQDGFEIIGRLRYTIEQMNKKILPITKKYKLNLSYRLTSVKGILEIYIHKDEHNWTSEELNLFNRNMSLFQEKEKKLMEEIIKNNKEGIELLKYLTKNK